MRPSRRRRRGGRGGRPTTISSTTPPELEVAVRPEPQERLAPAARWLWTLELSVTGGIATLIAFFVGHAVGDHTLARLGPYVVLVGAIANALVTPYLRARRFRWRLDDVELDLRHGALTDVRTVVPVARIQHVDVRRTPWAQLAGVASVVVHTAAGTTEIPALAEHVAAGVRDRIAGLIRTPDDD